MIKLSSLDKYYNKGRQNQVHAVDNIDMTLPNSGMIAFFGKSGCGKTTLLNMIGGLDTASSGEVLIDGKRICPDADTERNLNVGYIFQNYNLSERMNVFDNVAASLRLCGVTDEQEIENRVLAALDCVDMAKFRKRMPTALSGGQQQRVAIARAIVKNPPLILADEPTGNLDEQNTVMVMDLLKAISRERLVLLVTHEAHLVDSYCDKVIGISDGRVFEERENYVTEGYKGKKTNEVYLGDMNREELSDGEISFEYYGEHGNKPARIRVISAGGALYISADEGVKLKLADNSSELVVHEGKYVENKKEAPKTLPEELSSPLKPGGKAGRMYGFIDAVKSGYNVNFARKRKRKKLLILGMFCFSAIIVFFVARFGSAIYNYMEVEHYYNSHTVAVSADNMSESEARQIVADGEAELYTVSGGYTVSSPNTHTSMTFSVGNFETSQYAYNSGVYNSNIQTLPKRMLEGRELIVGTSSIESERDVVITRELADSLIKAADVSTLSDYRDLLYSVASKGYNNYYSYGYGIDIAVEYNSSPTTYRVVGIVEGDDEEMFFDEYIYLQITIADLYGVRANYISDLEHSGLDLPELEEGSVYVSDLMDEADKKKIVIGGTTYDIAQKIETDVTDGKLSEYSTKIYGTDLTSDIEAYLLWQYGCESFDDWIKQNYGKEVDSFTAQSEYNRILNEHKSFINDMKNDYKLAVHQLQPMVIMNYKDLEHISTAYSQAASKGLSANIYKGARFVFYSNDADSLGAELKEKYGVSNVITPDDAKQELRRSKYELFASYGISLIVVTAILAMCVYFIMRSALLGDIKEVGISRAIGVSKRNLCYRYFIESMVLFVLTVFVGYLLSSLMMRVFEALAMVYYPLWLALLTLGLIFGITAICGQIPIRALLRKTPSQILAKYDI